MQQHLRSSLPFKGFRPYLFLEVCYVTHFSWTALYTNISIFIYIMSTFVYYYTLFIRHNNQFKQHMLITTTDKVHGYQLFINRTLVTQFSKTFNFKVKLSLVFKAIIRTIKIISCLPKLVFMLASPIWSAKRLKDLFFWPTK